MVELHPFSLDSSSSRTAWTSCSPQWGWFCPHRLEVKMTEFLLVRGQVIIHTVESFMWLSETEKFNLRSSLSKCQKMASILHANSWLHLYSVYTTFAVCVYLNLCMASRRFSDNPHEPHLPITARSQSITHRQKTDRQRKRDVILWSGQIYRSVPLENSKLHHQGKNEVNRRVRILSKCSCDQCRNSILRFPGGTLKFTWWYDFDFFCLRIQK